MTAWTKVGWVIVVLIILAAIVFFWNLPTGSEGHEITGLIPTRLAVP
jgi:hypothetical protein